MAYDLDFRKHAVRYVKERNELQGVVAERLQIGVRTLQYWLSREKLEAR